MDDRLRPSRYNHFVETSDGRQLAFNAITCGLAEIEDDCREAFRKLREDGDLRAISKKPGLLDEMKKGGFVVADVAGELDRLRTWHYGMRFGGQSFGLTIIPTFSCNFACDYCYEDASLHSSGVAKERKMTATVVQNIVGLCRARTKEHSSLTVTWYGGEPLLARDVIDELTVELMKVCEERESKYHAGMITNGFLLNRKSVDFLLNMNVRFLQTTIDGPRNVHDKRRCLRSGGRTYTRIINNLTNISDDMPLHVSIRINIDRRNAPFVRELLEDLKDRGLHNRRNIAIYFSQTLHYNNSCPDIGAQCMVTREFSDFMVNAYKLAMELGFMVTVYPALQVGTCGAVSTNSIVIEPHGTIQNCWNTVGNPEQATGVLTDKGIEYNANHFRWLGWSAFGSECAKCSVLPLCMGGCPYKMLYRENVTDVQNNTCAWWKYNLTPMLELASIAQRKGLLRAANTVI